MSLVMLGLFLSLSGDTNIAVIAFALGGGLLGFLYYNFNPARIFMGDTGSLVLGFVASVLTVRLIQLNTGHPNPILPHVPVFAMSIVAIPVFDTLRVFALRLWAGKSPFSADKNHITSFTHQQWMESQFCSETDLRRSCRYPGAGLFSERFFSSSPVLPSFFWFCLPRC